MLESTLYRPQNLVYYEPDSNIYDLAAAYGYGLVKNHCFVDGNKRIALDAIATFLDLNGYELVTPEVEAVEAMVDLANDELSQAELAFWLSSNVKPISE